MSGLGTLSHLVLIINLKVVGSTYWVVILRSAHPGLLPGAPAERAAGRGGAPAPHRRLGEEAG